MGWRTSSETCGVEINLGVAIGVYGWWGFPPACLPACLPAAAVVAIVMIPVAMARTALMLAAHSSQLSYEIS